MADDSGVVRRIAQFILSTIRQEDLPSLRAEGAQQSTNLIGPLRTPTYITQTASNELNNEQPLGALASGYLKVTTTTGVVSSQAPPIPAIDGGTGQTGYAVGDILYASTTTALSKLAGVATGNALISGGVGEAPSWGKIGLTTHVSGTLGSTNGGTGVDNGGRTITVNTSSAVFAFTSGKTLTVSNSVTLAGTDGKTLTLTGALTVAADTTIAAGATNQIAYWSSASNLTSEADLTWNTGTNVLNVSGGAAATSVIVAIGDVATTNYLSLRHVSATQAQIQSFVSSGQSLIDVDPMPGDGTSAANFRFFRSTNTTGASSFDIFIGNGSATFNHKIYGSGGHTQLCLNNGALLVGRSSGLTGHGDLDVNGNFRAHGSSASGAQSADMGALAGAAAGWETNAQTNINAIRTCLRNHGLMA